MNAVTNMSWNYVAFAKQKGTPVVLKLSCDGQALHLEYLALQHFAGKGAIQVIDYSEDDQALLLQQAIPGTLLKTHHSQNLDKVISIYADVARQLSLSSAPQQTWPHVREWCQVIDDIHDPRVPLEYIQKAKKVRTQCLESMTQEYLCHGDLHLENIILSGHEWIAIDPKGVMGDLAFEASAFDLIHEEEINHPPKTEILKSRIQKLASACCLDDKRLTAWIFLKIMISIQWFIEDQGDPSRMIACAESIYPLC